MWSLVEFVPDDGPNSRVEIVGCRVGVVERPEFVERGVDAAVVGVPDERRGETVQAFVVPAPDAETTPEALKQYCLDNLAEYKHPREVVFVEELPRTTTGKVQKFELVGESPE